MLVKAIINIIHNNFWLSSNFLFDKDQRAEDTAIGKKNPDGEIDSFWRQVDGGSMVLLLFKAIVNIIIHNNI